MSDTPADWLLPVDYETRNLGRSALRVDPNPPEVADADRVRHALDDARRQHGPLFAFARLPKAALAALPALSANGFYFVEMLLHPYNRFDRNEALARFRSDPASFLPRRTDPASIAVRVIDKAEQPARDAIAAIAGESFVDDRFHLDPRCDNALADRRCRAMVGDLLANPDCRFLVIEESGSVVGFMSRIGEYLPLAGMARSHVNRGLGDFLWLSSLADAQDQGLRGVDTAISAANIGVLNLYARLGFKFRDPETTLHLWRD